MAGGRRRKLPDNAGLGGKDDLLALALARGMTQVEAAAEAGISERTVRTKLKDPAFVALKDELRRQITDRAVGRLTDHIDMAITKFIMLLDAEDEAVQHRAAKSIVDQSVKLGSFHDLAAQVAEIKAALKARGGM